MNTFCESESALLCNTRMIALLTRDPTIVGQHSTNGRGEGGNALSNFQYTVISTIPDEPTIIII